MRYLLILALAAVGCSSGRTPIEGTPLEIRLRGVDPGGYTAVLVETRDLDVSANGQALAVVPGQVHIDLTNPDHAWLAGTVRVPDGVDRLDVKLRLDDFGGYEAADGKGEIDARSPMSFSVKVDRGQARPVGAPVEVTALLDLAHSLVPVRDGVRVLLPQVSITP